MEQVDINKIGCPVVYTIKILRGKWKMYVIWQLLQQECIRFNELQRRLGRISTTVLNRTLEELQEDKIVSRVQYNEMPLRVEYSLTQFGKDLAPIFKEMGQWSRKAHPGYFSTSTLSTLKL